MTNAAPGGPVNREEMQRVIRRATELEEALQHEVSVADLRRIATEAGISPVALERALAERRVGRSFEAREIVRAMAGPIFAGLITGALSRSWLVPVASLLALAGFAIAAGVTLVRGVRRFDHPLIQARLVALWSSFFAGGYLVSGGLWNHGLGSMSAWLGITAAAGVLGRAWITRGASPPEVAPPAAARNTVA